VCRTRSSLDTVDRALEERIRHVDRTLSLYRGLFTYFSGHFEQDRSYGMGALAM
jgi:hypothetical protein